MLSDRTKSILLQVAVKEATPIAIAIGGTQAEIVNRLEGLTVDVFNTLVGLHDKLGLVDTDPKPKSGRDRAAKVENAALKDAPRLTIAGAEWFDYRGVKALGEEVSGVKENYPDFKKVVDGKPSNQREDTKWLRFKGELTEFAKANGLS